MSRIRRRLAPWIAGLALVAAAIGPAPALAADISFANIDATPSYNDQIVFIADVTSSTPLARVELRIVYPDALGPFILDVPLPSRQTTQSLRYSLDLSGGAHLVPNTPLTYRWAAFATAGADPVLSPVKRLLYADTTQDWRTLKGDLVTVHWTEGGDSFARKALEIGEQAIRDTSALLGVTETERVDFFIYPDEDSFRAALGPGTRENVGGQAHADIRTLFALITPDAINDPWVGVVIPHELVHLVFDTAVRNPYRFPPRWLNEGLAVYLSEGYGSSDRNRVADAVSSKDLIPLDALGGQFPADPDKTYLAYAEAVSAIDYLVASQGRDAMVRLVLGYKDGLTDDEAFTKAIGEDLATFQAGWLKELGAEAPVQFGPQPAPPGPLPSGWSGPAPTSAPGATAGSPTSAPGRTADPGPDGDSPGPASSGSSTPLLLGGVALVVLVVMGGLLLARRRDGTA